jgi:hypothetical protein
LVWFGLLCFALVWFGLWWVVMWVAAGWLVVKVGLKGWRVLSRLCWMRSCGWWGAEQQHLHAHPPPCASRCAAPPPWSAGTWRAARHPGPGFGGERGGALVNKTRRVNPGQTRSNPVAPLACSSGRTSLASRQEAAKPSHPSSTQFKPGQRPVNVRSNPGQSRSTPPHLQLRPHQLGVVHGRDSGVRLCHDHLNQVKEGLFLFFGGGVYGGVGFTEKVL